MSTNPNPTPSGSGDNSVVFDPSAPLLPPPSVIDLDPTLTPSPGSGGNSPSSVDVSDPSALLPPPPSVVDPNPTPTLSSGSGGNNPSSVDVSDPSALLTPPPSPPPSPPPPPPTCSVCRLVYSNGYGDCNGGRRCRFIQEEQTDENAVHTDDFGNLLQNYQGNPTRVKYHLRLFLAAVAEAKHKSLALKFFDFIIQEFDYTVKFGLYHVDHFSLNRSPKLSAHWFRDFLTNTSLNNIQAKSSI
ncbi:hypothetical protein MTR67_033140 [Solanum verrucosum]|uniref:Uncharacterized protein n=1 Tax=Solanum verrucosum TaxID=315347 RepID=A0AAF0ZIU9_SOLVR|nr:hypothetical protein MTR67_033140 [Solanum verrucosum]